MKWNLKNFSKLQYNFCQLHTPLSISESNVSCIDSIIFKVATKPVQ